MAAHAPVHVSDGLMRNRSEPETNQASMMNLLKIKPGLGDTIGGI